MKITANLPIIGMDIAKSVFQLHIVDPETGELERVKLKRDHVASFFANRHPRWSQWKPAAAFTIEAECFLGDVHIRCSLSSQ